MHKRSTAAGAEGLQIRVTDRWEDIAAAWREIERDGVCYPFQTLAWVSTLLDTVGKSLECLPRLILVTDGAARPLMLIPLAITRRHGLRILEFVDFKVSDYNAPIIDREFAERLSASEFAVLWSKISVLVGPFDVVRIEKMPADIEGVPNPFLQPSCLPYEQAWQAILEDGSPSYLATRSKSMLSTLGRKRRKLAKAGQLRFEVAATADAAEQLATTMIRLKSLRYRETGVPDLFRNRSYADFYLLLARRHWADLCHLSMLTLDGNPVSVLLGTDFRGRLCHLMPAFQDGEFAPCSPGQLHLLDLVEWCGGNRRQILDFTWGDEGYKKNWANHNVTLYSYSSVRTSRGWIWSQGWKLRTGLHRAVKAWLRKNPKLLGRAKDLRRLLRNVLTARPSEHVSAPVDTGKDLSGGKSQRFPADDGPADTTPVRTVDPQTHRDGTR